MDQGGGDPTYSASNATNLYLLIRRFGEQGLSRYALDARSMSRKGTHIFCLIYLFIYSFVINRWATLFYAYKWSFEFIIIMRGNTNYKLESTD